MPVVGIVIAAHNAGEFLADTLRSIARQSYRSWVCVVIDDGSVDGTREVADQFALNDTRILVLSIDHSGLCHARNCGLSQLDTGISLVTIMDADDVWEETALERLVDEVERHPASIGAHGLGEFIDEAGRLLRPGEFSSFGRARKSGRGGRLHPWPTDQPTCFETVITTSVLFPPGLLLMRRWVYERIEGYDAESLEGDWDLLIRATRHGDLRFINDVLIGYRRHESNLGARADMGRIAHGVRVRAFYSPENQPHHRTLVRDCWRALQRDQVSARSRLAREAVAARHPMDAVRELARGAAASVRFVRGAPSRTAMPTRSDLDGRLAPELPSGN